MSEPQIPQDASRFENPTQTRLRARFDQLTTTNRDRLVTFNPTIRLNPDLPEDPEARAEITLTTDLNDERSEPQFSGMLRDRMLRDLNLSFRLATDPDDPDIRFQYEYPSGDIQQIRDITRADGVKVPVFTTLLRQKDGHFIEHMELLSYDLADATTEQLREHVREGQVNQRLFDVGLGEQVIEDMNLTLEDKEGMLASYDAIHSLEAPELDLSHLGKLRMRMVKAMLPYTKFGKNIRQRNFSQIREDYNHELARVMQTGDLDAESRYDLIQRERLLRLSGLSSQLQGRLKVMKGGIAGVIGAYTSGASVMGALGGASESIFFHHDLKTTAIIGSIVGGGAILAMGLAGVRDRNERIKQIHGFSEIYPEEELREQLDQELRVANKYFDLAKF